MGRGPGGDTAFHAGKRRLKASFGRQERAALRRGSAGPPGAQIAAGLERERNQVEQREPGRGKARMQRCLGSAVRAGWRPAPLSACYEERSSRAIRGRDMDCFERRDITRDTCVRCAHFPCWDTLSRKKLVLFPRRSRTCEARPARPRDPDIVCGVGCSARGCAAAPARGRRPRPPPPANALPVTPRGSAAHPGAAGGVRGSGVRRAHGRKLCGWTG